MSKQFVKTYKPKDVRIEAMRFEGTERGINQAKKFAGSNFATQVVHIPGGGKSLRFLLKTLQGWVPIEPGAYICKGPHDFYPNAERSFHERWEVANDVEEDGEAQPGNQNEEGEENARDSRPARRSRKS